MRASHWYLPERRPRAKRLVLLGGTNDLGFPKSYVTDQLESIVKQAKSMSPGIEIFVGTLPPVGNALPRKIKLVNEINAFISKDLKNKHGVKVIDYFSALDNGHGYLQQKYLRGRKDLHPNEDGKARMREVAGAMLHDPPCLRKTAAPQPEKVAEFRALCRFHAQFTPVSQSVLTPQR